MSYGPRTVFSCSVASGASTSSALDLGGKAWSRVFVEVASLTTAIAFNVFGSSDGTTYRQQFTRVQTYTTSWTPQSQTVGTIVAAIGGMVEIDLGVNYVKFVGTGVVSGGASINVICTD